MNETGIAWRRLRGEEVVEQQLCNFQATIISDVALENGVETRCELELVASVGDRTIAPFRVSADQFDALGWVCRHLGPGALIYPGIAVKEHLAFAIKATSQFDRRRVFGHTGWTRIEDQNVYLHQGGALGPDGPVQGAEVSLPADLAPFVLPAPPTADRAAHAIRSSLKLLGIGPLGITVPLLTLTYLAPVGGAQFSAFVAGTSGTFKTATAKLLQQHYGVGFADQLPGSWSATANSLEELGFTLKDALFLVDDFVPGGTGDSAADHRKADRFLRNVANHAGRNRLRSDGTLRPVHPTRATVVSTGEDIPFGQSLRARLLVVTVQPGDIDPTRLTAAQVHAREGLYAESMSLFIAWLSTRLENARAHVRREQERLRQSVGAAEKHRRITDSVCHLAAGLALLLEFAEHHGALEAGECETLWSLGWDALVLRGSMQEEHQRQSDPADRFVQLLGAALTAGNGHVEDLKAGGQPTEPHLWGWRPTTGTPPNDATVYWPQGQLVGWLGDDGLFLEPEIAYGVVNELGRNGEALRVSLSTLKRRLAEREFLVTLGSRSEEKRFTTRRVIRGKRREVLHLRADILVSPEEPNQAPPSPTAPEMGRLGAKQGGAT